MLGFGAQDLVPKLSVLEIFAEDIKLAVDCNINVVVVGAYWKAGTPNLQNKWVWGSPRGLPRPRTYKPDKFGHKERRFEISLRTETNYV